MPAIIIVKTEKEYLHEGEDFLKFGPEGTSMVLAEKEYVPEDYAVIPESYNNG